MRMLSTGLIDIETDSIEQDEAKSIPSYLILSDNKISLPSTQEMNQDFSDEFSEVQLDELTRVVKNPMVKKTIAKLFKSQSKKFNKKQIMIMPVSPMTKEISYDHLIQLYGCVEAESYYKDYSDPFHKDLIFYLERLYEVHCVKKDLELHVVDVVQYPLIVSGVTDFDFVVDRYIKMQDQDYLELAKELAVYQYIVKNHVIPQMSKQKNRILKSQKKKEELIAAEAAFVGNFKNYLRQNLGLGSFYDYELFRSNFMTGQIELFQSGFSLSLASLLGVEQDQIENFILRGQKYYNEQSGRFRLNLFTFVLRQINNEIKESEPYPFILRTYDGIVINCQAVVQYITLPHEPKWIDKHDMFAVIYRFDINVNQIRSVLEIRSQQTDFDIEINNSCSVNNAEYQAYQEIFLERFYPEQFKGLLTKKEEEETKKNQLSHESQTILKSKRKAVFIN